MTAELPPMPPPELPPVPHAPPRAPAPDGPHQHLRRLAMLAAIEREARAAATTRELAFLIANRLKGVLPHDMAAIWTPGASAPVAVAGVSEPDPTAPGLLWLRQVHRQIPPRPDPGVTVMDVAADDGAPPGLTEATTALVCHLGREGVILGQALFLRAAPWTDTDRAVADRLGDVFSHALWALDQAGHGHRPGRRLSRRLLLGAGVALLLGGLAVPMRLSVVAPAAVVPRDPVVVGAPQDGVIQDILVEPNQTVRSGDLLFRLDPRRAATQVTIAEGGVAMAEADLLRRQQQAFRDPGGAAEVHLAETELERRRADLGYAREQLARTEVRAPAAGVVLFTDANDWLGRPVELGQRVMTVADPQAVEMTVFLPVDDALADLDGAPVTFYLNIAPLRGIPAQITHVGYEPEVTEAGVLAYRLRAAFRGPDDPPRVGLRGSARLTGDRHPLLFHILRRPLAVVRRTLPF